MIVATGLSIDGRLAPTDMAIVPGERVALVGPNGGGKTSLLRALAGVEEALGRVIVGGEDAHRCPPARRRRLLGFLAASRDLQWPIAVRDVIGLGLDRPDPARIEALLDLFELQAMAGRPSDRVSTGERARVLMARVLASRPALLLLDEPLSNLDPYWVLRVLDIVDQEAAQGAAVVVAVHDLAQLDRFDRAVLIDGGVVVRSETPDRLLADPAFERAFRVVPEDGRFTLRQTADRQSSP